MTKPRKVLIARLQYWASLALAPVALVSYLMFSEKFLLGLTLAISVWTQIASTKTDLDTLKEEKE